MDGLYFIRRTYLVSLTRSKSDGFMHKTEEVRKMLLNVVSGKETRSSEWQIIDEISIFLIDSDVSFQY